MVNKGRGKPWLTSVNVLAPPTIVMAMRVSMVSVVSVVSVASVVSEVSVAGEGLVVPEDVTVRIATLQIVARRGALDGTTSG
jgi:hypothetical protein